MNNHRQAIWKQANTLVAQHFNGKCNIEHLCVQPIEQIYGDGRTDDIKKFRLLRERHWMKELRTVFPYGLNDRCDGIDWTKKDISNITARIFNKITTRRTHRGSGIAKWSDNFSIDNFLKELKTIYYDNEADWMFYIAIKQLCHFLRSA